MTDGNATNVGMRARAILSHGGLIVQTIIPLNRYSFFESLSDKLLPPLQLEFEIELQNDQEIIFQNNATARRIAVRKFELWTPQLHFTGKGQTLANENFLKPTQWKYLNENLHSSSSRRDANGTWLITPGVKDPKHVFVFFQQTRKQNAYRYTLTPLTHFISMVMTQQDWTLAGFSTAQNFTLSLITTMTLK